MCRLLDRVARQSSPTAIFVQYTRVRGELSTPEPVVPRETRRLIQDPDSHDGAGTPVPARRTDGRYQSLIAARSFAGIGRIAPISYDSRPARAVCFPGGSRLGAHHDLRPLHPHHPHRSPGRHKAPLAHHVQILPADHRLARWTQHRV